MSIDLVLAVCVLFWVSPMKPPKVFFIIAMLGIIVSALVYFLSLDFRCELVDLRRQTPQLTFQCKGETAVATELRVCMQPLSPKRDKEVVCLMMPVLQANCDRGATFNIIWLSTLMLGLRDARPLPTGEKIVLARAVSASNAVDRNSVSGELQLEETAMFESSPEVDRIFVDLRCDAKALQFTAGKFGMVAGTILAALSLIWWFVLCLVERPPVDQDAPAQQQAEAAPDELRSLGRGVQQVVDDAPAQQQAEAAPDDGGVALRSLGRGVQQVADESNGPTATCARCSSVLPVGSMVCLRCEAVQRHGLRANSFRVETVGGAEDMCSVCLDAMVDTQCVLLSCGHLFHVECIADWLEQSPACPLCKQTLVDAVRKNEAAISGALELSSEDVVASSSSFKSTDPDDELRSAESV
jgi:hypothetical protein